MADQSFGISVHEFPILYCRLYRFTTVETDCVYLDRLTREKPADRQRFEGSLTEPFLLTIDGDPVLVG